jgi:branched-chain amino acid aminotransferase
MTAPLALWVDGTLADAAAPSFSPLERALTYGDGLFESLSVAGGRALDLDAHVARLAASSAALGLALPDATAIFAGVAACIAAAGAPCAAVRVTWTRGIAAGRGFARLDDDGPPRLLVAAFAARADATERRERGVGAASIEGCEPGDLAAHKTISALPYVVAATRARAAGSEEAILVDERGRVLEAAGANVFVVLDAVVLTPPASLPLLAGLTRARVLQSLGAREGIERAFDVGSVVRAEEAFLTNAVEGIVPLVSIDGRAIGGGTPGPRTRALQDAERVRRSGATQRS